MNSNLKSSQQIHEFSNTHKYMSENSEENENNQIQFISEDFGKIFDFVKKEINNLKIIENEMNNFKNKLSKLRKQPLNIHHEYDAKNLFNNKFESSDKLEKIEKLPNFKQESELTSDQMIGNLQLGNVNMASLENLLKLDLLSKNQNEFKNDNEISNQQNYPTNKVGNLNLSDEKLLKNFLKDENKLQNEMTLFNQLHQSNQNDSAESNKHKEAQRPAVNNKSESKKQNSQNLGMSLSEIEKQIAMLKNLSIKP